METMRAVIAIALLVGTSAHAQAPDFARATALYNQANAEMAAGRYVDAAKDYGGAYDITHDPVLFFKIGSANEKAGRCEIAIVYFNRYLKEGKPSLDHIRVTEERIKYCEDKTGVSAAPPPKPEPVKPQPLPPPVVTPIPQEPQAQPQPVAVAVHAHAEGGGHDGAWLLVGGSLAFVTAGAVLAYSASSSEQDLKDLYVVSGGIMPTYDDKTAKRYQDLVDQGHRYEYLSWASFGVAGACAIGATILFMRDDHHAERLSIAPLVGKQTGVAATLRF